MIANCPICKAKIDGSPKFCPECGYRLSEIKMNESPIPKNETENINFNSVNKTKKGMKFFLVGILVVLFVIGGIIVLAIIGSQHETYTPYEESTYVEEHYTIMYKVDGIGDASVTLENAQGGTEQYDIHLPWTKTLYNMHSGDFVYISAQSDSEYGMLDVYIYLNGIEVKHSECDGAYCIATASGRI
jgi:hypothetical protein